MATITLAPRTEYRRLPSPPAARTRWAIALPLWPTEATAVRVPGIARHIEVKIASTPSEWEDALELVSDNYQARGYEAPGASEVRFTSYHALPDTVVLVAKAEGRVVATFSLIADNHLLGLPLESTYRPEIARLRREGRRLIETTGLADRDLGTREFVHVFQTLTHLAFQYGVMQGADTNVITVNPRHSAFYTKLLGYTSLGPRRAYAQVRGAPAEALVVDRDLMHAKAPAMHQRMFERPLPPEAVRRTGMPAALIRQFAGRSCQTDARLVEEILHYVAAWGSPRRW
jgi:hypothetical protein